MSLLQASDVVVLEMRILSVHDAVVQCVPVLQQLLYASDMKLLLLRKQTRL
jgi:hypothetical protein